MVQNKLNQYTEIWASFVSHPTISSKVFVTQLDYCPI